jgi:RNase H-fold protein (predicted Holliday junction resolvase)
MTSVQAEKGLGSRREDRRDPKKSKSNFGKNIQTKDVDVSSAVIILQSYLDKLSK